MGMGGNYVLSSLLAYLLKPGNFSYFKKYRMLGMPYAKYTLEMCFCANFFYYKGHLCCRD